MGNELLDGIDGGVGDLEGLREGGVDERGEEELGIGEGEVEGSVGEGSAKEGRGSRAWEGTRRGGGQEHRREGIKKGLAVMGKLGVLSPGGILDDLLQGRV